MDGKPYAINTKKSLVEGNFSITNAAQADQFMNDMDAALVAAFPELNMHSPPIAGADDSAEGEYK